jgi:hypothetical protein
MKVSSPIITIAIGPNRPKHAYTVNISGKNFSSPAEFNSYVREIYSLFLKSKEIKELRVSEEEDFSKTIHYTGDLIDSSFFNDFTKKMTLDQTKRKSQVRFANYLPQSRYNDKDQASYSIVEINIDGKESTTPVLIMYKKDEYFVSNVQQYFLDNGHEALKKVPLIKEHLVANHPNVELYYNPDISNYSTWQHALDYANRSCVATISAVIENPAASLRGNLAFKADESTIYLRGNKETKILFRTFKEKTILTMGKDGRCSDEDFRAFANSLIDLAIAGKKSKLNIELSGTNDKVEGILHRIQICLNVLNNMTPPQQLQLHIKVKHPNEIIKKMLAELNGDQAPTSRKNSGISIKKNHSR